MPARAGMASVLDGGRYACDRAVHQLAVLTRPVGAMTVPVSYPVAFDSLSEFQWVPEGFLPPESEERDNTQRRLRGQYIAHLAGREI
jgi:hypothetical protein